MVNRVKYKWTVVLLVQAVDITWADAKKMITDLLAVRKGGHISILVCLNAKRENLREILPSYRLHDPVEKNCETTVFLKIAADKSEAGISQFAILGEEDTFDITDPRHLETFFKTQVLRDHAAEKFILLTWDHGNGYALFKNGKKVLTTGQLANAILGAFDKKKIDLIIMMNCYMQLFDTCLALSAVADHLVAAETLFCDMAPFDYQSLFQQVANDPALAPATLAKNFITSVESRYSAKSIASAQLGTAVFATALNYIPAIAREIDLLSEGLIDIMSIDFERISECRKNCGIVPAVPAALVDLGHFIGRIAAVMPPGWQAKTLASLATLLEMAILQRYVHAVFATDTDRIRPLRPSGFSLCFPTRLADPLACISFYDDYIRKDAKKATSFARHHRWSDFIAAYLDQPVKPKL